MDPLLRSRISALIGEDLPMEFQQGGEVDSPEMVTPEMEMMRAQAEQGAMESVTKDTNESIAEYINALMAERDATQDPTERSQLEHMAEAAELSTDAPMAAQAFEIAAQGRGEDTALAHLRPGEVVLPPEMFEDAQFEEVVENRFNELDLDPEAYVVGLGIASLNPITGLEEFGFFKKLAKSVKKVAKKVIKPIAQVAQFIPGPWQPIAALVNKAYTVYDVAKGNASPLALLTLGGPSAGGAGGGLGSLGKIGEFVTKGKDGIGLFGNIGKGLGSLGNVGEFFTKGKDGVGFFGNIGKELSGLVSGSGKDNVGKFGRLGDAFDSFVRDPVGTATDLEKKANRFKGRISALGQGQQVSENAQDTITRYLDQNPDQIAFINQFLENGYTEEEIAAEINALNQGQAATGSPGGGSFFGMETPKAIKAIEDLLKGQIGGERGANLSALGIAGLLGKLAYDEAKDRRGVSLTPLTQEGAAGRYNIEAEIARRTGQPAPNPVEFGLLPRGTLPTLSGGRAAPMEEEEDVMNRRYGGPVMAFAAGGNVAKKDFVEMDGKINGPGTEVSDDIPAMLSDGEFVMTGQAVRGAGAFDLTKGDGGIITLTPNGSESRDKGTNLMYEMMDLFSEFADKVK